MILGIDYGDSRIGVAIADKQNLMATPHSVIQNKGKNFVLSEIKNIAQKNNVAEIVVGMPVSMKGKGVESEQQKKVIAFVEYLQNNISIPVHIFDERLSSAGAEQLGRNRKKGAAKDDLAAMIILQSYINSNKIKD